MSQAQKTPASVAAEQGQVNGFDVPATLADKPTIPVQVDAGVGEALTCGNCGGWAQRLLQGQLKPTQEQSLASCWLRALGDGDPADWGTSGLCTAELRTEIDLTAKAFGLGPEEPPGSRWTDDTGHDRTVRRISLHDEGRCVLRFPWPPESADTRQGGVRHE